MEIASLVISVIALGASAATVYWVQRKTDTREYRKWRRDTLAKAVVELINLSAKRIEYIGVYLRSVSAYNLKNEYNDKSGLFDAAPGILATIEICEAEEVYIVVQRIVFKHKNGVEAIHTAATKIKSGLNSLDDVGTAYSYTGDAERLHYELLSELKKALK